MLFKAQYDQIPQENFDYTYTKESDSRLKIRTHWQMPVYSFLLL